MSSMTPLRRRSFSAQLLGLLLGLVIFTTLAAGAPAVWLALRQLEGQAWEQAAAAHSATDALYRSAEARLEALVELFVERPTLRRLAQDHQAAGAAQGELRAYLGEFHEQARLDFLLYCPRMGSAAGVAAEGVACPLPTGETSETYPNAVVALLAGRPALLAAAPVRSAEGEALGEAVAGFWLDGGLLEAMAGDVAANLGVVTAGGRRLAGSGLGPDDPTPAPALLAAEAGGAPLRARLETQAGPFFAVYAPLPGGSGLLSEVALDAEPLFVAGRRAALLLAGSTALAAALAAAGGYWLVRRLTSPLRRLTAGAERIAQGDFLAPAPGLTETGPTGIGSTEIDTLALALQRSQAAMLQALAERSQARDWLYTLIQSISEGVVIYDAGGEVTFFSDGAAALTGWPADEAVGRKVDELLAPAPEAPEERPLRSGKRRLELPGRGGRGGRGPRLPAPGQQARIEVLGYSGRPLLLDVTGAQLLPPGAETVQTALVFRDVTEEEARRHLRSHFLATISHEFRTPLSTLNASIELLLDQGANLSAAEMRELLKPTHLSLLALQQLIDNLLESGSIEAGRFTVRPQPVDLNEVIAAAVTVVQPMLERRSQSLSLAEPPHCPPLHADPGRITQVLVNLLVNASKYSPLGAPIDLSVEARTGRLRVAVADRGPGIPAAERENLFRRFVRLDDRGGEQYGVGLGLYVVKTIVEAHAGRVGVDARPGGGSAFWFELPLPRAERGIEGDRTL